MTGNAGVYPLDVMSFGNTSQGLWNIYFFHSRCRKQLGVAAISATHHFPFRSFNDDSTTSVSVSHGFIGTKFIGALRPDAAIHPMHFYIGLASFARKS